jgi:hypothetical protein
MAMRRFMLNERLNSIITTGLLVALLMLLVGSYLHLALDLQHLVLSSANPPLVPGQSDPIEDKLKTLGGAKARWSRQNISRYRLRIEQGDCQYDAEVRNETVIQTNLNTCHSDAITV